MTTAAGAAVLPETWHLESRRAAKAAGALHYFTGKPCPRGHVTLRHVSNGECRECGRQRASRWASGNREAVSQKNRDYYERRKDSENARSRAYKASNSGRIAAYNREYRLENLDRIKEKSQEFNRENRERLRERNRQFHARNPHKNAEYHDRRRALLRGAEGAYCAEDIANLTVAQGGRCAACRHKRKLTVDHIKPLSKGGSNQPSNIQLLCKPCNSSKRNRDAIEFMQSNGYLL